MFRASSVAALAGEAEKRTQRELAVLPSRFPVAMLPVFRRLTFGLLSSVVLGTDDPARTAAIAHALERFIGGPPVFASWPTVLRSFLLPALRRRRLELDDLLRAELERGPGEGSAAAALLASRLSEEELLAELRALLIVGQETTASALAWGVELLARHPRQALALAEHDGDYASAVAQETLRLRPSVVDAVRLTTAPVSLAGREFPPGTLLMAAPLLVHLDPNVHERPHEFRPERFLDSRAAPGSFIPFGGGGRRCLGAPLAMLQLRTVLPTIVRAACLSSVTNIPERARMRGTAVTPAAGAPIMLAPTTEDRDEHRRRDRGSEGRCRASRSRPQEV
jgi:cytochrome P450